MISEKKTSLAGGTVKQLKVSLLQNAPYIMSNSHIGRSPKIEHQYMGNPVYLFIYFVLLVLDTQYNRLLSF